MGGMNEEGYMIGSPFRFICSRSVCCIHGARSISGAKNGSTAYHPKFIGAISPRRSHPPTILKRLSPGHSGQPAFKLSALEGTEQMTRGPVQSQDNAL